MASRVISTIEPQANALAEANARGCWGGLLFVQQGMDGRHTIVATHATGDELMTFAREACGSDADIELIKDEPDGPRIKLPAVPAGDFEPVPADAVVDDGGDDEPPAKATKATKARR